MGHSKMARMMMMRDNPYPHNDYSEHKEHGKHDKRREEYAAPRKEMKFDRATAEHWVSEMESRDGTKGGKWTYEQTTQLMKQKGFDCDAVDFFAAMDMIYSDYGKTLAKYGVTTPDAYAELAYDWVKDNDVEAGDEKTAIYYHCIVK